jgi:hypothetical protein
MSEENSSIEVVGMNDGERGAGKGRGGGVNETVPQLAVSPNGAMLEKTSRTMTRRISSHATLEKTT